MNAATAAPADIDIRRARDAEGPACHMLVPRDLYSTVPREFLVAVQKLPPFVVAAASYRLGDGVLHSVRLQVLRNRRRQGIGSRLLRRIIEIAHEHGHRAVVAVAYAEAEPNAEVFLHAHDFVRRHRLTTVEADIGPMGAYLVRLRDRLVAGGRLPPEARLISYSEAPHDQVARLYAEHIVHQPEAAAVCFRDEQAKKRIADSPVLMVGDQVQGALLFSLEGDLVTIHARLVAPGLRGGAANAVLMGTATERVCAQGARHIRFEIPGDNSDTEKLARRFNAETREILDRYVLDLEQYPQQRSLAPA